MADDSVITDEMKAADGVESEPSVYEIERSSIRRWAEAIGDTNPLYRDEEYAKSKGDGDLAEGLRGGHVVGGLDADVVA